MDLTIIIPYCNGKKYIAKLLGSLPSNFPILVIDDLSDIPLQLDSQSFPNCKVLRMDKKGYFAGAVNYGIKNCDTDVIVINQDVWFENFDWVDLIYKNMGIYDFIGESIKGIHPAWSKSYIHGVFMYMSRKALNKVGVLDTKYFPHWGSTCEWQLRVCRQNFEALPVKEISGMHHERKGNYGDATKELLEKESDKKDWLIRTPPLISVIIPCYNHGKYLKDLMASLIGGQSSLGSMRSQSLQAFEVILVDDRSTDDTSEIMQQLADPWKGIHYYKTPINLGSAGAINFGIIKSNGKFITRIDADDMREWQSLENMYDTCIKNPHSFVYDDMTVFAKGIRRTKPWTMDNYDFEETLYKNQIPCGIMFPYEAWSKSGGYPEIMKYGREDWAFNIALGSNGYCGVHVKNPGYLYRREGQNRTLRNTTPEWRERFLADLAATFPDLYAGRRSEMCCGHGSKNLNLFVGVRNSPGKGTGIDGGSKMLAGSKGIITVQYQGGNYGTEIFYGPVTGTAYIFSKKRSVGNIDTMDAHYAHESSRRHVGILDLVDAGGRFLFKEYKVPKITPASRELGKVESILEPVLEPELELILETIPIVEEIAMINLPKIEEVVGLRIANILYADGIDTLDKVSETSDEELLAIKGVGQTTLIKLRKAYGV